MSFGRPPSRLPEERHPERVPHTSARARPLRKSASPYPREGRHQRPRLQTLDYLALNPRLRETPAKVRFTVSPRRRHPKPRSQTFVSFDSGPLRETSAKVRRTLSPRRREFRAALTNLYLVWLWTGLCGVRKDPPISRGLSQGSRMGRSTATNGSSAWLSQMSLPESRRPPDLVRKETGPQMGECRSDRTWKRRSSNRIPERLSTSQAPPRFATACRTRTGSRQRPVDWYEGA